jgi:site-specific DNA-methyltransferase (adenine-specific)
MDEHGPFDLIIADPPYGGTSLDWDVRLEDWPHRAIECLKPNGSMWVFGSMRYFIDHGRLFKAAGWKQAQDIVWEKQNGSGFAVDRFKRVHEHAVQFYRKADKWSDVFNQVQRTLRTGPDKSGARRRKVPHTGEIGPGEYRDDGTRIMRSVIAMQNMHGRAIHPTEKPSDLIEILIRTSCPPGGLVGDLFAGSGAAGEAAARVGASYVGFEIDESMARKAQDRLSGLLPLVVR